METKESWRADLRRRWAGGRVRLDRKGRDVFIIERMVRGVPYYKTLDAGNEREALAELALFDRDPEAYRTKDEARAMPGAKITTDPETVERYLSWLRREGRVEGYVRDTKHYLAEWDRFFKGRDLRKVTLRELRAELNRRGAAKSRIIAIKSFTAYLREQEATLTSKEDPTLDLRVPPPRPAKLKHDKGYTIEHIETLYRAINPWVPTFDPPRKEWQNGRQVDVQSVRDVLLLHAKTGMPASEIERLSKGAGQVNDVEGQGEIAGTIKFIHKSGRIHIQSVDAQTLVAVKRLQARGGAPVDSYLRRVIKRAVDEWNRDLKWAPSGQAPKDGRQPLKTINFGELRHSFVTWAAERGVEVRPTDAGVPLTAIASAIGHASAHTTKRFYEGVKVPPMIKVPIRLEHPDDSF